MRHKVVPVNSECRTTSDAWAPDQHQHDLQPDSLPFIPDTLPFHFALDVAAGLLGSVGSNDRITAAFREGMCDALQQAWISARKIQEETWIQDGQVPLNVEKSFDAYGGSLSLFLEDNKGRHGSGDVEVQARQARMELLDNCVEVLSFQVENGQLVPGACFENVTNFPHVFMVVDLKNDPFLVDCGYTATCGRGMFRVFLNVYDRFVSNQDPERQNNVTLMREMRLARIVTYDAALLFAMNPHHRCRLHPPVSDQCCSSYFPPDQEIMSAGMLQRKLLEVRATLGWVFWEVFDMLFPKDGSGPATVPLSRTSPALGRIIAKAKGLSSANQQSTNFRDCTTRDQALAVLWSISLPEAFEFSFFEEVRAHDGKPSNLLALVQEALYTAASSLKKVDAVLPSAWQDERPSPVLVNARNWPLTVKKLNGQSNMDDEYFLTTVYAGSFNVGDVVELVDNSRTKTSGTIGKCATVVEVSPGFPCPYRLEWLEGDFEAPTNYFREQDLAACRHPTLSQQARVEASKAPRISYIDFEAHVKSDMRPEKDQEHKWVRIFLELSRWESERVVSVFDISATGPWSIDQMIGVTAQLEETVNALRDSQALDSMHLGRLERKVSQLAYGFRALQRAYLKQNLRNVGISVLEVERQAETDSFNDTSISSMWIAKQEVRAFLRSLQSWCCCCCGCCGVSRHGVEWLDHVLKAKHDASIVKQRVMLLSAPSQVFQQRAVQRKMVAKILPNEKSSQKEKQYPGGFVKRQFHRDGPTMDFYIPEDGESYPYEPYFAVPQPATDPHSILSPAEKKYFLKHLIEDGPSDIRFPDGTIDPRRGGADMDPRELIAESLVSDFASLREAGLDDVLMQELVTPWRKYGLCWFFSRKIFVVDSRAILQHFGPQVASYFEFAGFLLMMTVPLAVLGISVWLIASLNDWKSGHDGWSYVMPIFSICSPVWGMLVCTAWRSRCQWLTYDWANGIMKPGPEVSGGSQGGAKEHAVRPEFSHRFRKGLAEMSASGRGKRFQQLRHFLGLPRHISQLHEDLQDAFHDKVLAQDFERFNESCFLGPWERRWRDSVAVFASGVFIILACATTAASMWIQDRLAQHAKKPASDAAWHDYLISSETISYIVSGLASGVIIPLLNYAHNIVADWTTDYQELRHDSEHQGLLFTKLFIFQFFNTFNSLFWVAFVRQSMEQLQIQILMLAISIAFFTNLTTVVLGMFLHHFARLRQLASGELQLETCPGSRIGLLRGFKLVDKARETKGGIIGKALATVDHEIACSANDSFSTITERIEIGVQFSMLAMFSGVYPLLPLVLLVVMLIELRIDAYKLVKLQRFPRVHMLVGIGRTYSFLIFLSYLGLMVNCLILIITKSHGKTRLDLLFPNLATQEKILVGVLLEHLVLVLMFALFWNDGESTTLHLEKYRQMYFENRESTIYNEDCHDSAQLYAIQKMQSKHVDRANLFAVPHVTRPKSA